MAKNILIIDDIQRNVDSMTNILGSKGFVVDSVPDYASALKSLLSGFPHIFFINSKMEHENSFEIFEQLKKNDRIATIPTIYYSSKDDSLEKLKAFRLGAVDYIAEPFYLEELFARLNTHLSIGILQKNLLWTKQMLESTSVLSRVGGWEFDIVNNELFWSSVTKEIHEVDKNFVPSVSGGVDFYKEGESRDTIVKCIEEAMTLGKSWDVELQLVTAKGNDVWVRAIGKAVIENGEITRLCGTFQNINDAQEFKLNLQKSESSLRAAEKIAKSGSWEWISGSNQLFWSSGLYRILELDLDVWPSWKLFFDKIQDKDNCAIGELSEEEIANHMIEPIEYEINLGKGLYKCIRSEARVIHDKDGVQRYVGTLQDITDKKLANEEYELLNKRFQLSFEVANIAICQIDVKGHFKMVNDSALNFFGFEREELIGRHFNEITHQEDVDVSTSFLETASNGIKHQLRFEKRYIHKSGATIWGEVSSSFVKGETPDKSFFITYLLDITERKRGEEVLHRYKNIVHSSSDILALCDKNYNYVIVNKSYADCFGMDHEKASQFSVIDIIGKEKFGLTAKPAADRALNGEVVRFETWMNFPERGNCYMEMKFTPHTDQQGEIQGYVVDGRDITEKKRSKDRLRALTKIQNSFIGDEPINGSLNQMLNVLLDLTQSRCGFIGEISYDEKNEPYLKTQTDVYWSGDVSMTNNSEKVKANELNKILGEVIRKREIVISNSLDEECPMECGENDSEAMHCFIGLPFFHNNKLIGIVGMANKPGGYFHSDGEVLEPFLATCSTVIKAHQEASKKRRVEKELGQLAEIVSHSNDAIISTDLDLKVISWNEGAEKLLGYTADGMLGSSILPIKPRREGWEHDEMVKAVQGGDSVESHNTIQIRKDGTPVHVNMSMFPLREDDGEVKGVSSILRDITTQKEAIEMKEKFTRKLEIKVSERTAELLKAKAELAVSLKNEKILGELKSRFVATASHQFRTPLTVIQSNMSVLAMQMQELDNNIVPSFDKVYTRIKGQISRMTSLMDDVLILGKINAGSIQPLFESVDAVALCREMVNNYNEIDENGQRVEFKYNGSPKSVNLDPKLLEHIISNLVSNALKYSVGRPSPSVVLHFTDSKLEIIVADHGMGIPTADVNHLFEPFYRASNVENVSGTGLGSTIAKEYTELMNGTISVKSKINEGSQFIVEFITSEDGKFISS